jgi:hypothetical protein
MNYAIIQLVPQHLSDVKTYKLKEIEKTIKAVKERLTAEIQYWDFRAADLKQKEDAGKANPKVNSLMASRRANELSARLKARLDEIDAEKDISPLPPVIIGGALIIPAGLFNKYIQGPGNPAPLSKADQNAKTAVELAAMKAVMDIETSLGFVPRDVSADHSYHYDIESFVPPEIRAQNGGNTLRMIEVKGRTAGADTVTVSKNEILTALNKSDDFILALVEVDGVHCTTRYLTKPFRDKPDFAATSVNYSISELLNNAKVVLERRS